MSHKRSLIAIRDPAHSVPARWRLYHGGAAKRGYLVTHDPESNGYVGDYVYFSTVKRYAQRYMRHWRGTASSLFVVDGRYLPQGTRVLRSTDSSWPPRGVEARLFDLIDMQSELRIWIDVAAQNPAYTMLHPEAPRAMRDTIVDWLKRVGYLCRTSNEPGSPTVLSSRAVRALRRYLDRLLEPRWAASCGQPVPLDEEDYPCSDRWRSPVLYLLDTFGTLDFSVDSLRSALALYRQEWLAEFSTPLSASNLDDVRQVGVAATLADPSPCARNGMIVLVPGPIAVLDGRRRNVAMPPRRDSTPR